MFAVVSKNLVEVFDEVSQVLDVVGLFLFTELLGTLVWVELANKIICEVNSIVSDVSSFNIFWVEPVLLAEVTKNCARLIVVLAVLHPNWDLAVGEFSGSLAWTEFFKANALISVFDSLVSKKDSDFFTATVDTEVNEF